MITGLFRRRRLSAKDVVILSLLILMLIGQLWFIFGNSCRNADESNSQSDVFIRIFTKLVLGKEPEMISVSARDSITFCVRKAAHMTEFGVLAMLWLGISLIVFQRCPASLWGAIGLTFICAVCDEVSQLFSDGRACSAIDMMIDTVGGLIAASALYLLIGVICKNKLSERANDS